MEQFTGKKMQSSAQPPSGHLLEADSATRQGSTWPLWHSVNDWQPAYCGKHALLSLPV